MTTQGIVLQRFSTSFFDVLSSPTAKTIYLIVLMLLVAALTVYILLALHAMRQTAEKGRSAEADTEKTALEPKTEQFPRFEMLRKIEEQQREAEPIVYESRTLPEICTGFRDFAASQLGLYYELADIRRFVAGMGISRLMILRGMSGTGKTSLAYAAGEYFGNASVVVPVQPMWKERSDMIGYFNEFTKRFNETPLLCKLYEAGGNDAVYIVVLDEVNISRIEYYFAEFLSLLELPDAKKRMLPIVSDSRTDDPERLVDGRLQLPENVWFVGTANNDDSTFSISDKVYDRAAIMDLERKCTPFYAEKTLSARLSYTALQQSFAEACRLYTLSEEGRTALARVDAYLGEVFRISFGNRIMRQIESYVAIMQACGGTENEALDDILARKILRKLEQQSPALLKNELPSFAAFLTQLFGEKALPQCSELLTRLKKNV